LAKTYARFLGGIGTSAVGALASKIFVVPQNTKFGGDSRDSLSLELNVGSVLLCIDAVYCTIYFTL